MDLKSRAFVLGTQELSRGLTLGTLDTLQTSLLISLCHVTGWSAECIGAIFEEVTNVHLAANQIWGHFWRWTLNRQSRKPTASEVRFMKSVILSIGIDYDGIIGTPLNLTQCPRIVAFKRVWCPKVLSLTDLIFLEASNPTQEDNNERLCPGYDGATRAYTRSWLYMYRKYIDNFCNLSPYEQNFINQFGPTMEQIIYETMKGWGAAWLELLAKDGSIHRPLGHNHVLLVLEHLNNYVVAYEGKFGVMVVYEEETEGTQNGVIIRSTAFGVKVLIGLMMADRLRVISRMRTEEAEKHTFVPVAFDDIQNDEKACMICLEELYMPDAESVSEVPIKLRVCCGKLIGDICLKTILNIRDDGGAKCPHCRFVFPPKMIDGFCRTPGYDPNEMISAARVAAAIRGDEAMEFDYGLRFDHEDFEGHYPQDHDALALGDEPETPIVIDDDE